MYDKVRQKVTTVTNRGRGKAELESHQQRSGNCSLAIRFPKKLFLGKSKRLFLFLEDTSENRLVADNILNLINSDIALGQFDVSLERYKPRALQREYRDEVVALELSKIPVCKLWKDYYGYKLTTGIKETTKHYLKTTPGRHLEVCPIPITKPLEVRNWLLERTTKDMTKRCLVSLNAAYKWGIKLKVINDEKTSPYEGLSKDLGKFNYEENSIPNAFTPNEQEQILNAFRYHTSSGRNYQPYYPLVYFLFATGCRPSEAIGLRWINVKLESNYIFFCESIKEAAGESRFIHSQKSKNNKVRKFPINQKLREFLESLPRDNELVFPSPSGKIIRYSNFSQRAWKKIVDPIKPDTTPYSCRDTFITTQIAKGIHTQIIAKWLDTSVSVIEAKYLDTSVLGHIMPQ